MISLYFNSGIALARWPYFLALIVLVGFCDREYSAEPVFQLVNGLWSDHAIEACQFVSEGDQRVVCPIAFGRCHGCVLLLVSVDETA